MKLGNLEKINLREVWAREDTHFTQWLAKEENISVLLDEIGVSAENVKTEDNACVKDKFPRQVCWRLLRKKKLQIQLVQRKYW